MHGLSQCIRLTTASRRLSTPVVLICDRPTWVGRNYVTVNLRIRTDINTNKSSAIFMLRQQPVASKVDDFVSLIQ